MKNNKINELSIILPVFNEACVINKVVQDILDHVQSVSVNAEIIFVDDGSFDSTQAILNQFAISCPNIKIISHQRNEGYGNALRSGIKVAQGEWILLMDSDGQIHIDSLGDAWALRHGYDLLLGYRQKRSDNIYRRLLGKLGNRVSNLFLRRNVKDINCGFKLFRRNIIQPLILFSSGGIINFEILYQLFKEHASLKWQQFPVKHYPRRFGKSTGSDPKVIGKIFIEGLKILLNSHPFS